MAITAEQRDGLVGIVLGMFEASPNAALMEEMVAAIDAGQSLNDVAGILADTNEFKSLYPVWLTNEEFSERLVDSLLGDYVSDDAKAAVVDQGVAALNGGASRGDIIVAATQALMGVPEDDATFGAAATAFNNKVEVATYFIVNKLDAETSLALLQSVVEGVDDTESSVSTKMAQIDADLTTDAQYLTDGQDILTGSANNDTFVAYILDNSNTAESGDIINGGGGDDTLRAEIGDSQGFAITMKTDSVENAWFRAQATSNAVNGDNDNAGGSETQEVQIDAQDMAGTLNFWNYDSRADLLIEDIQADSHTVTIGWQDSDPGDVDYEVYFDNITAPGSSTAGSQLFLEIMDLQGMETDNEPLLNNPYIGLQIMIGDEEVTLTGPEPIQTSYADLVTAINNALIAEGYTNVTAELGSSFIAINSDTGADYEGTQIVLTNSGPEVLSGVGWIVDGILPPDSNVHTKIEDTPPATADQLTQTDVIFDYVGSGSKGGDFIAGEMSTGGYSGSAGIQQFNIQVGAKSWLDSIASTNNTLEVVNVENIVTDLSEAKEDNSLRIDDLDDVRVFDASAMEGSVTLSASLSDAISAKYLDNTDDDSDPTEDNSEVTYDNVVDKEFSYDMGAGADSLTLEIEDSNLETAGTANREDFVLDVNGNAGNDMLTLKVVATIGGATAVDGGNWYLNHDVNANLSVDGGAGNDTINLTGSGDWVVEGGSGDDTVYTDNSGAEMAKWLINADNVDISNLEADTTVVGFMPEATLTVTISGATTNATPAGVDTVTEGAAAALSNGFEVTVDVPTGANYVVTNLHINQAIKSAINNDPVLSKLLVATDGPGQALIITSLVDGEFAANDLLVSVTTADITSTTLFTDAERAEFTSAYQDVTEDSTATLAAANTANTASGTAFNGMNGMSTNQVFANDGADIVGAASEAFTDNTVTGGTGDDVLVLSNSVNSVDTLVWSGSFGNDTVVNFVDGVAAAGGDILDFTAYLTNVESGSGSGVSQTRIATTVTENSTVINNEITIINSFAQNATDGETFAALTAANFLAAVNNDNDDATEGYGSLVEATLEVGAGGAQHANLVGTEIKGIVLVENDLNDGEYKVFEVTGTVGADFTAASLVGTIDFGDTIAAADVTDNIA